MATAFDPESVTSPAARLPAVIALPGEIDITNARDVHDALARAVDGGATVVIANAIRTTYCDCAGVRALIGAHRRAAAAGTALRVAAVTGHPVRRILELTGADQILAIYPTVAAAGAGQLARKLNASAEGDPGSAM